MITDYTLTFELQSYWHIGNGKQAGAYADALMQKDNGLPFIPGKSINGLLRDAFRVAEKNDWFGKCENGLSVTVALFGEEGRPGSEVQGLTQLTSATLSRAEQDYFQDNLAAKSRLYKVLTATAINDKGVADEDSLRSIEVTVPMTLNATLTLNRHHPNYQKNRAMFDGQLQNWLSQTTSLITALGAKRHRGLGKVIVSVSPVEGA
jgi:CRISPR/Cas system CSM-associated protein Csm3 (group 7 of RAMP superfamily)